MQFTLLWKLATAILANFGYIIDMCMLILNAISHYDEIAPVI